jgi:hypothetical protein
MFPNTLHDRARTVQSWCESSATVKQQASLAFMYTYLSAPRRAICEIARSASTRMETWFFGSNKRFVSPESNPPASTNCDA